MTGTATAGFQDVALRAAAAEQKAAAVQLAAAAMGGTDVVRRPNHLAEVAAEAGKHALSVALTAMRSAKAEKTAAPEAPAKARANARGR